MMPTVIFLAIVCVWPAADGQLPKIATATAPSMEICLADIAVVKKQLEADPTIRYVNVSCIEMDRGEKS